MSKPGFSYLIIVLIISLSLQVFAASQKSFWEDEAYTAAVVQESNQSLGEAVASDVHPPIFLLLLSFWGDLWGYSELGLRSLAILFSVIVLLMTFVLALNQLGEGTALAAVTLLGFSPLFIMYGYNARYYSMAAALTLLVIFATVRYLASGRLIYLLLYLTSSVISLYVLFSSITVILACNFWCLFNLKHKELRSIKKLLPWVGAQMIMVILYIPGYYMLTTVTGRFVGIVDVESWPVEVFKRLAYSGFVFSLGETLSPLNPMAWLGALGIATIAIYSIITGRKHSGLWLSVFLFVFIVLMNILISMNIEVSMTWQNISYRAFYALPFLSIWLGHGIAGMRPKMAVASVCVLLVIFGASIINFYTGKQYLRPISAVPWRELFENVQDEAKPGSLVVCGRGDYACYYYARRYDLEMSKPTDWVVAAQQYPEIWWIQINLSRGNVGEEKTKIIFEQLAQMYNASEVYNYAWQDPSIRWLKTTFLHQDDYEYRVVVTRFYNP